MKCTFKNCCLIMYLLFFFVGVITVANILLELQFSQRGISRRQYPWRYLAWEEVFSPFTKRTHNDDLPPY